jgi:hypothetical protein
LTKSKRALYTAVMEQKAAHDRRYAAVQEEKRKKTLENQAKLLDQIREHQETIQMQTITVTSSPSKLAVRLKK